ncbi:hypothetical protein BOTBODRAFT_26069 [Botryobasidium botryosum FD-172 SS1]|uniref:Beta-lactamase-related domain-containing protein n=1 Tax=Botryobasidium botryosum (strain FD-172 SS1) TaxID=930990 RepID=A0A067NBX3_BOTB1|nr:hypothetical protein BOTBODRAFT_26069 [Botryobasidium botryosum FD-172 SS1]
MLSTDHSKLDSLLRSYTGRTNGIPGVSATVVTKDGPIYTGVAGVTSADPERARPMAPDTVYWIASQTKIMTAIAAMQCVERSQIALDDPVGSILPELAELDVIEGFERSGRPKLRKAKTDITLRMLLTHTSGLAYNFMHPDLIKRNLFVGKKNGISERAHISEYDEPLVFEPGSGWAYGTGLDRAGQMIERLNGCTLEDFMKDNIWTPLGMTSTTFRLETRPDLMSRKVDMTRRRRNGVLVPALQPYGFPADHDLGGIGVYSTVEDYGKLLQALLQDGHAGILKPESVNEIFKPQLEDILGEEHYWTMFPGISAELKVNFGLSTSIRMTTAKNTRKVGSGSWLGYPNLMWWVDRKTGVACTIFKQILPVEDPIALKLDAEFESAVYECITKNQLKGKL